METSCAVDLTETSYVVDLTAGEILIIKEALERSKEEPMPQWMYELTDGAVRKMEEAYEKPRMTAAKLEAEVKKEKEYWDKWGIDSFLVSQMAREKEVELRFWNDIEGEEI